MPRVAPVTSTRSPEKSYDGSRNPLSFRASPEQAWGTATFWHGRTGRLRLARFSWTSYYLVMVSSNSAGESARSRWQSRYEKSRVRDADFTTLSGVEVEPAYGSDDSEWPGEFPFPRGLYPTGYRGRTWTIRQFAGFGNCLLYTSPSPRDLSTSRMPSSA